jgi:hypothetical protein
MTAATAANPDSCAHDGLKEEAILLLGEVPDKHFLIGGQGPRRVKHFLPATLPGCPTGTRPMRASL